MLVSREDPEGTVRSPDLDFEEQGRARIQPVMIHVAEEEEISSVKPLAEDLNAPSCMYQIVTAPCFNFFIFILIILNTVVLALDDFYMTERKTLLIHIATEIFTWTFFLEMVLKLWGLSPQIYVKDSFNRFDAFVVSVSIIDWTIAHTID